MQLRIEKIVTGGYGLARVQNDNLPLELKPESDPKEARGANQVILVEGALPGEVVEAEPIPSKGVLRARVTDVLEASKQRVPAENLPPTLNLAHASYEAQLEYKREFVLESLERIGKISATVLPTHPSPDRWHYRTVVQYAISGGRVGYRGRESHDFVALAGDPIASEQIHDLLERLNPRELGEAKEIVLRSSRLTGEVLVALIGDGDRSGYGKAAHHLAGVGAAGVSLAPPDKVRFGKGAKLLWGEKTVLEKFGALELSVSATGFAQVNPLAASELYLKALKLAGKGQHALDLYGGAGSIGLNLASQFERVTVLDVSREALERGDRDANRLKIGNVEFFEGEAADMKRDVDLIVLDPPRAGLDKKTLERISASKAQRTVYISCDPSTWGRDVGVLARAGWKLTHVEPWDFYPQTAHVEVLSLLER